MHQRLGTTLRIAVLFIAFFAALAAHPQEPVVDYALEIVPSDVPYPGGEIGYALVVTGNWSTNDQEPFTVQLTVPAGLEPGTQCNGGDGDVRFDAAARVLSWSHRMDNPYIAFNSCPMRFRIDPTVPPGSIFSLTGKLTTSKPDPNPANDTATIETVVVAASDLAVSSSADRRRVKPGETITYTLQVNNLGPQTANDVTLTDHLSALVSFVSFEQTGGTPASVDAAPSAPDPGCFPLGCSGAIRARIAALPAASGATFRLVVVANTSFEAGDIWNRVAVDSPAQLDLTERNDLFDELVSAGPDADLAITSRVSEVSGTRTTLLLRITNDGPETVNGVTVQNALASATWNYQFVDLARYASVTPSQGTCTAAVLHGLGLAVAAAHPLDPASWSLDCQLGMLAPGAVATIAIAIESAPGAGLYEHSASVHPSQNDPRPENNLTQLTSRPARRRSARH